MSVKIGSYKGNSALLQLLGVYPSPRRSVKSDITSTLSSNEFSSKVEQHISDYKKGRAYLSSEVGAQLSAISQETAFLLSNPQHISLYNGYLSAFSYDQKARFIDGVSNAATNLNFAAKIESPRSPSEVAPTFGLSITV